MSHQAPKSASIRKQVLNKPHSTRSTWPIHPSPSPFDLPFAALYARSRMPDVSPLRKIFSVETGMNETTPLRMEYCNSANTYSATGMSHVPSATLQRCNTGRHPIRLALAAASPFRHRIKRTVRAGRPLLVSRLAKENCSRVNLRIRRDSPPTSQKPNLCGIHDPSSRACVSQACIPGNRRCSGGRRSRSPR
jgi:hypothetical protein